MTSPNSKRKRGRQAIPHESIGGVEHKRCGTCKQQKPLTAFSKSERMWDRLANCCRPCMQVYRTEYERRLKERGNPPSTEPTRCSKCHETKPASEFYACVTKPNGLASYCKPCSRAYTGARAKTERVKAVRAQWAATKGREVVRRYNSRHPAKKRAREIMTHAISIGELVNPRICEDCAGCTRVEGHHDDYALPLVIRWLCRRCHRLWHRENGEGRNADTAVPVGKRHEQHERRRARHVLIPNMLAGGMRQKAIAVALGVTQATICQDLKALRRE